MLSLSARPLLSDLRGGERKRGQERGREKVSLCYADQADAWRTAVCYRDNRAGAQPSAAGSMQNSHKHRHIQLSDTTDARP